MHVLKLSERHRRQIKVHLLALSRENRYMRFCTVVPDTFIEKYVDGIDFQTHVCFGVFSYTCELVGLGELVYNELDTERDAWEFAVSVLPAYQRKGLGSLLLNRLVQHSSLLRITHISATCHDENSGMQAMAKKFGMTRQYCHGDLTYYLELPPISTVEPWREVGTQIQEAWWYANLRYLNIYRPSC